jgi:hypothetical protein
MNVLTENEKITRGEMIDLLNGVLMCRKSIDSLRGRRRVLLFPRLEVPIRRSVHFRMPIGKRVSSQPTSILGLPGFLFAEDDDLVRGNDIGRPLIDDFVIVGR